MVGKQHFCRSGSQSRKIWKEDVSSSCHKKGLWRTGHAKNCGLNKKNNWTDGKLITTGDLDIGFDPLNLVLDTGIDLNLIKIQYLKGNLKFLVRVQF